MPVAVDAGVWGLALGIGGGKPVHHLAGKLRPEIQHHVGNPQLICHGLGILRLSPGAGAAAVVEAHGGANAVVPRLLQQVCGNGAVHPAAHGHQNTVSHCVSFPRRHLNQRTGV